MKKGDKFVLLALVFVALMIVATMGYRILSEQYAPQQIDNGIAASPKESASDTSNTSADDESSDTTVTPTADFAMLDFAGNYVKLSDYFGKPIIVNFWATWCGPCQSEMPAFDTMYQKYGDEVHFIMLNLTDGSRDTVESVTEFIKDAGYTFPVYFDASMEGAYTYSAYSIPMTLFITPDGQLAHTQMGAMSEETLEKFVETLIEISKEVTTNESNS